MVLKIIDMKTVVHMYKNVLYNNKKYLSCAFLFSNGRDIYAMDRSGACFRHPHFGTLGSGSTYIKGLLSDSYQENMTASQVRELTLKALAQAVKMDSSSGGSARIYDMKEDGTMTEEIVDYYDYRAQ